MAAGTLDQPSRQRVVRDRQQQRLHLVVEALAHVAALARIAEYYDTPPRLLPLL